MNLGNLNTLKARFGNNRNFNDLIDTLAAINKPPLSIVQTGIPFLSSAGGVGTIVVPHTLGAVPSTHTVGLQVAQNTSVFGWSSQAVIGQGNIWAFVDGVYVPAISSVADASNVYITQAYATTALYLFSFGSTPMLTELTGTQINNLTYYVYASLDYIVVQPTDPFIVLQPASQSVAAPAAAQFVLAATGTPTLTYQWQVSTNSGLSWAAASGGVYSGNTTQTLTISNSTGLNGNQYQCVVINGVGNSVVSNIVSLSVM